MNNLEKMLVQLMTAGIVIREEQWFKSKGITVKIELENIDYDYIDYDYIDKAMAEMNEPEEKTEDENSVDSSELREFFDAKFGSEKHD